MVFKKLIIAVAVFSIFAAGAFTAYQVSDLGQKDAPADPRNVTNEETIVEYDAWQYVDNATRDFTAGFDENVTVENETGYTLQEGQDYTWNSTDGTIKYHDTPHTTEGNVTQLDYTYYWNTQAVREVSVPISGITEGIGQTGYLAGGIALVIFIVGFGAIIASKLTNGMPQSNR